MTLGGIYMIFERSTEDDDDASKGFFAVCSSVLTCWMTHLTCWMTPNTYTYTNKRFE
jgi:hypothetical protein